MEVISSNSSTSTLRRRFPGPAGRLPAFRPEASMDVSMVNLLLLNDSLDETRCNAAVDNLYTQCDNLQTSCWEEVNRFVCKKFEQLPSPLNLEFESCSSWKKLPVLCLVITSIHRAHMRSYAVVSDLTMDVRANLDELIWHDYATYLNIGACLVVDGTILAVSKSCKPFLHMSKESIKAIASPGKNFLAIDTSNRLEACKGRSLEASSAQVRALRSIENRNNASQQYELVVVDPAARGLSQRSSQLPRVDDCELLSLIDGVRAPPARAVAAAQKPLSTHAAPRPPAPAADAARSLPADDPFDELGLDDLLPPPATRAATKVRWSDLPSCSGAKSDAPRPAASPDDGRCSQAPLNNVLVNDPAGADALDDDLEFYSQAALIEQFAVAKAPLPAASMLAESQAISGTRSWSPVVTAGDPFADFDSDPFAGFDLEAPGGTPAATGLCTQLVSSPGLPPERPALKRPVDATRPVTEQPSPKRSAALTVGSRTHSQLARFKFQPLAERR